MKILLTGASGFVGSSVLDWLLREPGVSVAAVVRPGGRPLAVAEAGSLAAVHADLYEPTRIGAILNEIRPDTVIHLAWGGVLNKDRDDPRQLDNLRMTMDLLDGCRRAGVRHWIGLGSQGELGLHEGALDENAFPRPRTLYGIMKLSACYFAENFCRHAGMRFAWLRLFSAYGPRDDARCMIPYVILELLHGRTPAVTEGRQLWDYLQIDDVAQAVVRVALTPTASGVFHLGSGQVRTVRQVIEKIRDLIDPSLPIAFGSVPYGPNQVMHLQARPERLRQAVNWAPAVDFEEGIRRTIDWYRSSMGTANRGATAKT